MNANQLNPPADSLCELTVRVERDFSARFSCSPDFVVAAPGRVNLIGEHIDYNDGFVLPMAIERYVVVAAALKDEQAPQEATLYSVNLEQTAAVPVGAPLQPGRNGWICYVEGVVAEFQKLGATIPAFHAVIQSNLPLGCGLASSAALEVAVATLLEVMTGKQLDPIERALLCQRAEHRFAGVPCGIMDQFSSVLGRSGELMLLDCRSQQIDFVPLNADDVTVLITNSNIKHELTGGEYAERRKQCDSALTKLERSTWRDVSGDDLESACDVLSETEHRRARHVVTEIARTEEAATAFQVGNWERVGELMYASHASLRDDYEVSCEELDVLVELAHEIGDDGGVVGSRMTGGGFGGCTVSLVKAENVEAVTRSLVSQYKTETGIQPNSFASRPAPGAHVIRART